MKKIFSLLLITVMLMSLCLPLSSFADNDSVSIVNTAGVIYPGCSFTLYLQLTTENDAAGVQLGKPEFDEEKLTLKKISSPVSGWTMNPLDDGGYLFVSPGLTADMVTGKNQRVLKMEFSLKENAPIGTKLEIKLPGLMVPGFDKSGNVISIHTGDLSYKFTVEEKPKNKNCNLIRLSASEGTLSPAFNEDSTNNNYAITVNNSVTSLTMNILTANELATYAVSGNEDFQVGENTVKVTVTAESGDQRVYTITVTRLEPPSTDVALSELTVKEGELSPSFDANTYSYSINVPSDVLSLTLQYKTSHEKAKATVSGNQNFKVGDNTVSIIVTAEDGITEGIYTLTVYRERPIETSAFLTSLSFADKEFDKPFDGKAEDRTYRIIVPYEEQIQDPFSYQTESSYATVKINAPESYEVGENTVTLTVTAEDGSTLDYTVIVTRDARILSSNASLEALVPSTGTLLPAFDPEILTYVLVTEPAAEQISFDARAAESAAGVKGGELALSKGLNSTVICCTAEDGTVRNYMVYVFVPVKEQEQQQILVLKGEPQVGSTLTFDKYGDFDESGSFKWLVGGEERTGTAWDGYTVAQEDKGKTVKVVYTDTEGNTISSAEFKIVDIPESDPGITVSPPSGNNQVIFAIVAALVALIVGVFIGRFFTQSNKR